MSVTDAAIDFSATVGGVDIPNITQISASSSVRGRNSRCTISFLGTLSAPIGADVQVYASLNGSAALRFRGDLLGPPRQWQPWSTVSTIECTGLLARLTRSWGGDARVYDASTTADDGRTDFAIIQNLIEAYGIPSSRTRIFASEWNNSPDGGTVNWLMGQIRAVVLDKGERALDLIDRINVPPGFALYDQPQGFLDRTRDREYYADPSPSYAFTTSNTTSLQRLGPLPGNPITDVTVQGITYQTTTLEHTASASSAILDNLFGATGVTIGTRIQSDLLELDWMVEECAAILLQDKNIGADGYRLTLENEPYMLSSSLQDTITITLDGTTSDHRILEITDQLSPRKWQQTITTNGGTLLV